MFKRSGSASNGNMKGKKYPPPRNLKEFPVSRDFPSGCMSHFASRSRRSPKKINSERNVDSNSEDVVVFKPLGGASKGPDFASTNKRSPPKQINSKQNVDSDSKDVVVFKPSGGATKGVIKGREYPPPRNLKGFPVFQGFPSRCTSHFASTIKRSSKQMNNDASSSGVNVDPLRIYDKCGGAVDIVLKEECSKWDKQNGCREMVIELTFILVD
ncbi:hypothetical protein HS088_TW19G00635 [Tripterygium wilfordii]|uniref:Uncharacterized protein n=1 Tax=Tripterygium wilfordii TaxID=458696 RepID=A0A7J7CAB0_TRIWF|nr:hypothetical protein HS088_TW19G00635 [Tripterygium wilfordii]